MQEWVQISDSMLTAPLENHALHLCLVWESQICQWRVSRRACNMYQLLKPVSIFTLHPSQVMAPKWNPEEGAEHTRHGISDICMSLFISFSPEMSTKVSFIALLFSHLLFAEWLTTTTIYKRFQCYDSTCKTFRKKIKWMPEAISGYNLHTCI